MPGHEDNEMLIRGITIAQAEQAARQIGVTLYNLRDNRNSIQFVIRPESERYRAIQKHMGQHRRKWAVCWHGHREFMRALFAINPDARITTCMADYRGAEDFERKFNETGYTNIGSQVYPIYARQGCECED